MDLSGRFDFWRMLIHTRAITPPRAVVRLWRRWGVPVLLIAAAAGATVHFSNQDPPLQSAIVDRPPVATTPKAVPRAPSW
jgi:hypothetical protein